MKHLILVLATTLFAANTSQTDEGLRVRYLDPSGRMTLTLSQGINVRKTQPVAGRELSFDLVLAADPAAAVVTVTIDRAKATYAAHSMEQRLGTRHLTGQTFTMAIADDGRRLELPESADAPVIDLGPPVAVGFSIAEFLADTLPVLPEQAVAVGATWTTERQVHSLGGWAWGTGWMTSRHRVTAVDRQDDHTVVSVTTVAEASLGHVEGERGFSGDLKQTLRWTFDATDGRLLSMSMEQETEGDCPLQQGDTRIYQLNRVELAPLS